jgi:hypothetical protein
VNPGGKVFLSLNEHRAKYGELRYYDEPTRDLFQRFGYVDHRGGVTIFRDRVVGSIRETSASQSPARPAGARLSGAQSLLTEWATDDDPPSVRH